jgi:uncharacterized membrane protein YphA (DoxX/SURF4 family)
MNIGYTVVIGLLAALLLISAGGKLVGQQLQLKTLRAVGFPLNRVWLLAVAELAGAVGLVTGYMALPILGVLASIGLVCYFIGAITAHLRAADRDLVPSSAMLLLSVASLALTVATRYR